VAGGSNGDDWPVSSVKFEVPDDLKKQAEAEEAVAGQASDITGESRMPFFKLCTNVADSLLDAASATIGSSASCSAVHVHQTTTGIGSTSGAITCRSCWGMIRRVSAASRPAFAISRGAVRTVAGILYSAYSSPSGP
jgi:hypothetical protein